MSNAYGDVRIGLEVHARLQTRHKLFCHCPASDTRGTDAETSDAVPDRANTRVCPICLGHPGTLPVLNREAVVLALRAAIACDCLLHEVSVFARKHYFYPDLPKGYQITQYDHPLATGGALRYRRADGSIGSVTLQRMHLEEDAGKLLHRDNSVLVDFNRSGVPLLEIVTTPCLHTPADATAFLGELRRTLMFLGVCDGDMERASFRCDANVSLDTTGGEGQRTELKNLNSFRYLDRALHWEIERQQHCLTAGESIRSVTLLWDESQGRGHIMREKEHALEYHYIDDPDLPPLHIPHVERQRAEHGIAELPLSRAERFERAYLLSARNADALTSEPRLADFFEELLAALQVEEHPGRLHAAVQWVRVELLRVLHRRGWDAIHITPATLALLLRHLEQGTVTRPIAKTLFDRLCKSQEDATALIEAHARKPMHDAASLRGIAREVLSRHPEQCHTYRNGKKGLIGFFMRQVMEATGGSAHPAQAKEILRMLLDGDS